MNKTNSLGQVFDSVTKQPIGKVVVTLRNMLGQSIATSTTDDDGYYTFTSEEPGIYRIIAENSHFKFPSVKLAGKTEDQIYSSLYFGEEIVIKGSSDIPIKNIPMDQIDFNWDKFIKTRKSSEVPEWSSWSKGIWNMLIKKDGKIVDAVGVGMPYAIVSVYSAGIPDMKITFKITNELGEFYCPVPNGTYIIKVDEKTGEDTYNHVFTSDTIIVTKGKISGIFNIKRMSA